MPHAQSRPVAADRRTDLVEGAAVSASLLCLVHCLALPLMLMVLPAAIGLFARSEAFHAVALLLIVPSALAAFWLGHRRHRAPLPALFGIVGVAGLVIGLLPLLSVEGQRWATVVGSLLLVTGHLLNWRLRARAG